MTSEIQTITTPFAFNISVNCYLVRTDEGYILIDTGMPNQRRAIAQELESAGCHDDAWMRGLTPCMNAGALIKNLGFGMRGFIPRINSGA